MFEEEAFARLLAAYDAFGSKASGGEGDEAAGAWLQGLIEAEGYACERQAFEAPAFAPDVAELACGEARAGVWPQPVVVQTPEAGVRGPLRLAEAEDLSGAVALVRLPFRRWSALPGEPARRVADAFERGAAAAVLVTTGPTGEALALNAPADRPMFDHPVAVLAPRDETPFVAAAVAGAEARLTVRGTATRRPAYNLIGRLRRGGPGGALVISTPRSGWHGCMGERGPGVAAFVVLARWAARALTCDVELVCTSGHEYENLGGEHYLAGAAPDAASVGLWVHLGANLAARDWRELGGRLAPLPSADPQRILMASPDLLERAQAAFAGQPGLEAPLPATVQAAAGELINILRAGYAPAIGVFGAHRFHHAPSDGPDCAPPDLARRAAEGFAAVISATLGG